MIYQVYWQGAAKQAEFTDYDEALEYAQTMTFEESTLNTAIIVARKGKRVRSVCIVTWFSETMWTIETVRY